MLRSASQEEPTVSDKQFYQICSFRISHLLGTLILYAFYTYLSIALMKIVVAKMQNLLACLRLRHLMVYY